MATVLGTSSSNMLLYLTLGARQLRTCCCGAYSGHINFEHLCMAIVLDTSAWENVAVTNVLGTSVWDMLLWLSFRAHRLETCCCGYCSGGIDLEHLAVANVLGTST